MTTEAKSKHTGKTYRIRTRNVGQSFGCIGEVVARNGRVVASGPTRPHGMDHAAMDDARRLAEEIGAP